MVHSIDSALDDPPKHSTSRALGISNLFYCPPCTNITFNGRGARALLLWFVGGEKDVLSSEGVRLYPYREAIVF